MKRWAMALALAGLFLTTLGCAAHRGCGGAGCGHCAGCLGRGRGGGSEVVVDSGPATGAVTYPYYTTRGPRDFLARSPKPIGP